MNKENKKVIKYEGELDIAGFKLPCYNLEDGTAVLSNRGMQDVLKIYGEVEESKEKAGSRLKEFLNQKALKPFIYRENKPADELDKFSPNICYKGGTVIHGYKATTLVDICKAVLMARKEVERRSKKLTTRLKIVADQSEILLGAFAKVGIVALVAEATGYQKVREQTLQEILKLYISEEILEWQKTFHDGFYEQIFRLWGIPFTHETMKRKPPFVGILTIKLIYDNLPEGVVERIKEINPKTKSGYWRYSFHRLLTPEVGREHLKKVIYTVEALAKISKNKNGFLRLVKEMYLPKEDLPYIDVEALEDSEPRTKVDKVLEALLKTPAPKEKGKSKKK